jgi:hypothetical protein
MNNDNYAGGVLIVLILGLFFAFGFLAAKSNYQHDTFDCTNTCGGKHSIQYYVDNNKVCFCEVK